MVGTVSELLANGKVTLHCGDMLDVLAGMPEHSVDSVVTDPPYHLTSIVRRFGNEGGLRETKTALRAKAGLDPHSRTSRGFMGKQWDGGDVAFRPETWRAVWRVLKPGGHVIAFSGTRTYHRMACAIEDAGFEIRDQIGWMYGSGFPKSRNVGNGWGTALKPAWEPCVLARKPLIGSVAENVLAYGTGAINVDGCRVGTEGEIKQLNAGRWPANIIHDGSDDVVEAFPDAGGGFGVSGGSTNGNGIYGKSFPRGDMRKIGYGDSGSAARFFYTAKADVDDRLGSEHPTVKPIDLMQYLVRLVTPKGGVVLDCFAGTGTTGEAAFREGMRAVLIEREAEYQADIRRRISLVLGGAVERRYAAVKARGLDAQDAGPLFACAAE